MNKLAGILIAILVTVGLNGQEKVLSAFPNRFSQVIQKSQNSRNIIWSSDFSDKSEWIINNDADNYQNWKITNNSPLGFNSSKMGKIKSTTPENNFALFDSEFMGDGVQEQKGNITNSNPFSCLGYNRVILEFQSYYLNLYTATSVKITTNGGDNWHEIEVNEGVINRFIGDNPEFVRLDITDIVSGKDNIQIRFFFDGLENNLGVAWMVDDVVVYEPNGLETDLISLDNYWLMGTEEEFEIVATLQNLGAETIHSVTYAYKINDFYSDTVTLDTLAYNSFETFEIKHPQKYTFPEKGRYYPSFEILKINSQDYQLSANGEYIDVYNSKNKKAVVLELFTSPTSEECYYLNEYSDLMTSYVSPHLLSTIRYPMDFPDEGDPYFSEDCEIRKDYYGVVKVPFIYLNGAYLPQNELGLYAIEKNLEKDAVLSIDLNGFLNDSNITVDMKISSSQDLNDLQLYVAVNEKETKNNKLSNGEESFSHLLLKMLPDGNGTYISEIIKDDTIEYSFSFDLKDSFMEQIHDLEIIAFVEDLNTYDIIQSANLDLSWYVEEEEEEPSTTQNIIHSDNQLRMNIYPNPSNGILFINEVSQCSVAIYDNLGKLVFEKEDYQKQTAINLSGLSNGMYIVKVTMENKTATKKFMLAK